MSDEPQPGALDRLVELAARGMDALGLNGTRLRWKWNTRRRALAERGAGAEMTLRAARGKHKMCRSCRALVPRFARSCPECGESLSDVAAPGVTRTVSNMLPGMSNATAVIMLINGLFFALTLMAQIKTGESNLFARFSGELLFDFGSGANWMVLNEGEWWRLITPIFLHGGLIHFGMNSYCLLFLGPLIEEEFGLERFWTIYLLCGIGGSVASQIVRGVLFHRGVNTVGASGAIFGLVGFLFAYGWMVGGARRAAMKAMLTRMIFFVIVLTVFAGGGIDHMNHAGGMLTGALLGLLVRVPRRGAAAGRGWSLAALAGVVLVLYSFFRVAGAVG